MFVTFVTVCLIGKLILFLFGQLPIHDKITSEFWHKLFTCNLCLGCHLFFVLCCFYRLDLVSGFTWIYIPIMNEYISGMMISFLVHLVSLGWKIQFSEFKVI